jgi:hypothetical protein
MTIINFVARNGRVLVLREAMKVAMTKLPAETETELLPF